MKSPCTLAAIYWIVFLRMQYQESYFECLRSELSTIPKLYQKFSKFKPSVLFTVQDLLPAEVLQNTRVNLPYFWDRPCWGGVKGF